MRLTAAELMHKKHRLRPFKSLLKRVSQICLSQVTEPSALPASPALSLRTRLSKKRSKGGRTTRRGHVNEGLSSARRGSRSGRYRLDGVRAGHGQAKEAHG